MKTLSKAFFVLVGIACILNIAVAQTPKQQKKIDEIKTLVNGINYVFVADYVIPLGGTSRALNSSYDFRVTKDTVTSFLPYFGRAYVAPLNASTDNGIKFTSTHFDYTVKDGKKGGWEVVIKPKGGNILDMKDVQQVRLSISATGYATLYVTSANRDPISFNGTIETLKK